MQMSFAVGYFRLIDFSDLLERMFPSFAFCTILFYCPFDLGYVVKLYLDLERQKISKCRCLLHETIFLIVKWFMNFVWLTLNYDFQFLCWRLETFDDAISFENADDKFNVVLLLFFVFEISWNSQPAKFWISDGLTIKIVVVFLTNPFCGQTKIQVLHVYLQLLHTPLIVHVYWRT